MQFWAIKKDRVAMAAAKRSDIHPPYFLELRRNIAVNLRTERLALGLTQKQLGDLATFSRDYVRRIEAEGTNVSMHTLCALAEQVGRHPMDLLSPPSLSSRSRRR